MKYIFRALCCSGVFAAAIAQAQVTAANSTQPAGAIGYATEAIIAAGDTESVIAEKAGKLLPRPNQMDWMRLERTFFIHFGPNTFNGVEWGTGREDPAIFNPTALDADQWLRTIKAAGGNLVILVAKHHDGLCLWPTRYSDHSVASSPWRGGKGDLVREVADAARKHGVRLGIYLSPADLYQLRTNPTNPRGYYGNGSDRKPSTIPTDPGQFQTNPLQARGVQGAGTFTYDVDDYNRYFLNHLYELLTQYGRVDEVWFDGANPDPSVAEAYDYTAWYDLIRKLQPHAIIFGKGPDARWVGNEEGVGRTTEWSVVPLPTSPEKFNWPDMHDADLGSRAKLQPGTHLWWYPAEVNTSILYGWFWAPGKPAKTAANLIDVYYQSVGRNGNMLLNLPPDTRGLIPDDQVERLKLMARVIGKTFGRNLATGGTLGADTSSKEHDPSVGLDGNPDTWWEAAPGRRTATLTLTLPKPATFDVLSLQEAVDQRGQRIENFAVDVWDGANWNQLDEQTTVGHKRLLRWATPVTATRLRVRITGSRLEPTVAELGLYKQADTLPAPVISGRSAQGKVSITGEPGLKVVYTTDGSTPTKNSKRYSAPIELVHGGTVNAASIGTDGALGMSGSRILAGSAPIGWQVLDVDGSPPGVSMGASARLAIDDDPATFWEAQDTGAPHSLTIDLQAPLAMDGIAYLPRQDGKVQGLVDTYRVETSVDGTHWDAAIDQGRFGNIRNNPILQKASFPATRARYLRFTCLRDVEGTRAFSAAEVSVLPVR